MSKIKATFSALTSSQPKLQLPECSHSPQPYKGPSYDQVLKARLQYMPTNLYPHLYKKPLLFTEGHYQYLFDHEGSRYLDLIAGISTISVGHSHPRVVDAIKKQAEKLIHTTPIYMNEFQGQYSKELCEELGEGFDTVIMTNSGGEANDLAIMLARLHTGNSTFLSQRAGYHGLVGNARSATNMGTWNSNSLRGIQFEKLPWPCEYRGVHKNPEVLINDVEELLVSNTTGKLAGAIFECIQGVGGVIPVSSAYLQKLTGMVKKREGLIICDEVQTGFGRIGKEFWGHRMAGIKPDILTMAKGIANGMPVGAVVTRKEIASSFTSSYFNTYGGGHLQSVVASQVLNILKDEELHLNAQKIGKYLLTELKKFQSKYELVGNVRGKGLMIGIELVRDKKQKTIAKEEAIEFLEMARERKMLVGRGGHGNVIRLQPPLCVNMKDAKYIVEAFDDILHNLK